MALPQLVKYVYNNGTDEVIRRGKKILSAGNIELVEYDDLTSAVIFRVKDDAYATFYKVHISHFRDTRNMALRCGCPYNLGEICRHKAAALLHLQEMMDRNQLGERTLSYDQRHTVIKMKQIDLRTIRMLTSPESFAAAEEFLRGGPPNRAAILEAADERVIAEVPWEGRTFRVAIQKNEERNFDTSCDTDEETTYPLCAQKTIVFLQLLHQFGPNYFDTIRNWDKEKNKLLALYGYSLSDDISGKFEFTYKEGKPFLRLLDPSVKRVNTPSAAPALRPEPARVVVHNAEEPVTAEAEPMMETPAASRRVGVVFSINQHQYPYIQADAVLGESNDTATAFAGRTERLDLAKFIASESLSEEDRGLIQQLRKLLPGEVSRYLNRNSPFSGIWENIVQQHDAELPEETRQLITEYLHPKYRKIFSELAGSSFSFYIGAKKTFQTSQLAPVALHDEPVIPAFSVTYAEGGYSISCDVKLPTGQTLPLTANQTATPMVFLDGCDLYLWKRQEDVQLSEKFLPSGVIEVPKQDWSKVLQNLVLPLTREYSVHFNNIRKNEVKNVKPDMRVFLREKGDYLLFQPVFFYNQHEVRAVDGDRLILPDGDQLLVIRRDRAAEEQLVKRIESLHSGFVRLDEGRTLALKGMEVLRNNWFFLFIDAIKELNIPVTGFEALRNFRFNTAKPSTKIFISSHTDWFDAKVNIHFGDQQVTIDDVRKALTNKQQYVQLQDGTLGILPEEWIKKYSLLFKVGEGKSDHIKLSRFHVSVIEELYEQRDERELVFQLEQKYERLKSFESVRAIDPPEHLVSVLRPYQASGFQWLNYLSEVGWGGILADDMGLGKTVQALCFLHHLRKVSGRLRAMVVCPTTLMYNWENEIRKFTPALTYYIHHGGARSRSGLHDLKEEIIITTYGTLRSDIRQFLELKFDYVVLDESQAIKNPSSKVTRAASLLNAKNRLCLSGTPLQNNTFDIYAQMNFLNPGMLGSIEHFKQEFSLPIDKFGEKDQKEHLRRLLFPFILRRTKEQVARDLPAKSEMVLFCEMGPEQREIYDAFRNDYRDKILGAVDTQGIQRSQLTILQGLMKLRQICDSPAIMKEEEQYPNVSVKLDEIGREILENIGNHKALVFSQFLGMLALIRERLEKEGIPYEYFDGSTSAPDREKAVQRFQNDDTCRVFLISLKAGGVGLNLTAADYVYLVDPWWNPAVEQQAIDRTHRIGQTKNIFAYRMICKDTVEDKILQLQERKKNLAADLITDDSGFVKNLTRADIEYLFS